MTTDKSPEDRSSAEEIENDISFLTEIIELVEAGSRGEATTLLTDWKYELECLHAVALENE